MPQLLAAASVLVATAAAVSLLLLLPAVALAETAGERNAAGRAQVWLAAVVLPPATGIIAAATAIWLHMQGFVASPHLGGQRPHLCLLPIYQAPGGAYRLELLSWLALVLVLLALLRLLAGAVSSHLLRRLAITSGAPASDAPGNGLLHEVQLSRPTCFNAGLLRPVVVASTALRGALDPDSFAAVLAHEQTHCTRRDNLLSLLVDVCSTLLLPVPTAYHYRRQWRAASEAAADDGALQRGADREALLRALQALRSATGRSAGTPSLAALLIPETPIADQRLARLHLPPEEAPPGAGHGSSALLWSIGIAIALLALVTVLTSTRSLQDTLFCAAEQFIRAAR